MGPLTLPETSRKRRWGWLLVWTLLVFTGGVAAGVILSDEAISLVERACAMLRISPPHFLGKAKLSLPTPAPALAPAPAPSAPVIEPLPSGDNVPAGEKPGEAPAAAAERPVRQAAKALDIEKSSAAAAPKPVAHAEPAAVPSRAEMEMPAAHSAHGKSEAKTSAAKTVSAKTTASAPAPAAAGAGFHDPFVSDDERTKQPPTAVPSRKSRPSFDDPAPTDKSEPTAKPVAKSQDSLDNLMADVVTDNKGKGKARDGKGLDALLKDVQVSKPEPPPKREAPEQLPPLSSADISRVMVGVKMRSKDCAQQLGQKGIAELKLAVGKDGTVTSASVGGKLANTPVATCIEKAVRAASFPRSAGLRFDYRIDVR